jgi:DNA-binding beta-propeller fold protein YncE
MPRASAPYGLVFSPAANDAYVALEATGQLLKLDASTGGTLLSASTGPNPRHVAINAAGTAVYVSRFVTPRQPGEETATVQSEIGGVPQGGELLVFASANLALNDTIVLQHSNKSDAENQGSGVPNYLGAAAVSPDGTVAWVPSKMDNVKRGSLRNGLNINFQNTVRAIGSSVDLAAARLAERMTSTTRALPVLRHSIRSESTCLCRWKRAARLRWSTRTAHMKSSASIPSWHLRG